MPRARSDGLLVEEMDSETLVYDLESNKAHCLNRSAAEVWRSADGATPIPEIAGRLRDLGLPADEAVVWMALGRLRKANLLDDPGEIPEEARGISRREVMLKLGRAAGVVVLLPAVATILTPVPAQAASCITLAQCEASTPPNCTGLPICGNRTECCQTQGVKKCHRRKC